jgi:hypothetical protein
MASIFRPSSAKILVNVPAIVVLPDPPFPTVAIFISFSSGGHLGVNKLALSKHGICTEDVMKLVPAMPMLNLHICDANFA